MSKPVAVYRFGNVEFEPDSGRVRRNGDARRLQPLPLELLLALLARPGKVVTRDELRQVLWPEGTFVDFDEGLNHAVQRLREALGDSAESPRFIETIPRRGYRFLAQLEVEGAEARENLRAPELPRPAGEEQVHGLRIGTRRDRRFGVRRWLVLAIAVLVLLGAVGAAYLQRQRRSTANTPRFTSLAVLPLTNVSKEPEQEFLAYGLTDELITTLSKIGPLSKVISHTSTARYRNTNKSLPQIARELQVDAIIEGTVLREGNLVHVNVQLIDAASDRHIWAETYDFEVSNIIALQAKLAHDVASHVQIQISSEDQSRVLRGQTSNAAAYDLYLRGRYLFFRGDYRKAADYFQRASEADPTFALAIAQLGESLSMITFVEGRPGRDKEYEAANNRARRALQIAPDLAEAHDILADELFYGQWKWAEGLEAFRYAVELDGKSVTALHHYALALYVLGRYDEALEQEMRALAVDPLNPQITATSSGILLRLGRYDEAVQQCRRLMDLEPTSPAPYFRLGLIYEAWQRPELAKETYLKGVPLMTALTPPEKASLTQAVEKDGAAGFHIEYSRINIVKLQARAAKGEYASPLEFARNYAWLGRRDDAIQWLERAYQQHIPAMAWIKVGDGWEPLRTDRRFRDLLRRMGLPD